MVRVILVMEGSEYTLENDNIRWIGDLTHRMPRCVILHSWADSTMFDLELWFPVEQYIE